MTPAAARAVLLTPAYFVVGVPRDAVQKLGDEVALAAYLRGSYTDDDYDIIPLEESDLYREAIVMAREHAVKAGGRIYVLSLRRAEVVYLVGPRSKIHRFPRVLRIIKLRDPKPLELEKFPMRSFDPGAQN